MKKEIFLLALIIIFTSVSPWISYGQSDFDAKLEESILKAKKIFDISKEYDKFESNINSYDGEFKFNLSWSDTKENLSNLNITMDIEGNVISFDKYPNNYMDFKSKLPKYSRDQARDIALSFINKVSPDIKSIKTSDNSYTDNLYDDSYYFRYTRYVDEIEYRENNIDIVVNKYTGQVVSYFVNWERKVEFPKADNVIGKDKAKEKFKEKIGLKPVYKIKRDYNRPEDIKEEIDNYYIAYTVLDTNQAIDAFSGDRLNINRYMPLGNGGGKDEAVAQDLGISPEEKLSIDKVKNILNGKEAEEKAREILNIEKKYKLQDQNLYKNYKNHDEYIWDMYFVDEDEANNNSTINIGINGKSGELLSFYKSKNYNENDKVSLNKEEALKLAKDYLNKKNPDKGALVELKENTYDYQGINTEPKTYQFEFIRKEKDIYVEGDGIYIGIDAVDGDIISYSIDWYKGAFPSSKNIISIEKAYEVLWEKLGIELSYINTVENIETKKEDIKSIIDTKKNNIIRLVYLLNPNKPAIINASSGEILDYSGKPYMEKESINYTDIDASYAREKIVMLAKYGIGFEEDKFLPKEEIKQSEYVYLLWRSINQYRTDIPSQDEIYNDFIKSGYMKEAEKNPDAMVTKVESIKYIIRIMQLTEVAELQGIYKDIFKDSKYIKQNEKGYINIAYGLNIIRGNGTGNIEPDYKLKRQDAANIIYNYLFR